MRMATAKLRNMLRDRWQNGDCRAVILTADLLDGGEDRRPTETSSRWRFLGFWSLAFGVSGPTPPGVGSRLTSPSG